MFELLKVRVVEIISVGASFKTFASFSDVLK